MKDLGQFKNILEENRKNEKLPVILILYQMLQEVLHNGNFLFAHPKSPYQANLC